LTLLVRVAVLEGHIAGGHLLNACLCKHYPCQYSLRFTTHPPFVAINSEETAKHEDDTEKNATGNARPVYE
jgi:hypothetical protein